MTLFYQPATPAASQPAITASQALTGQAVGHPQQSASEVSYSEAVTRHACESHALTANWKLLNKGQV